MGSRLVWLSLALSVAFSAGQDTGTGATREDIPEGASTLAFVFDVTGSMYDDLVQVIEGASKILETSLSRPKRPLYNFALVPFHDPEIGPVTITTDPKKFQYELRELYVQGGGDCPEMSIGAIKIALEISLPGSYIYVFTDARSKDYKLTHEVLQLIQQKQSQVVFVLTGDCDDRTHIGYKAYEEIASTSSGQVFHLDKKQVNEVLKWVEEAVQSSKVHLLSTDHFSGVSNTWQMPFDPSLKEVTVALSGPAPSIEIKNPEGKVVGKSDGLTELLHIPNSAKVVNIKDPQPGMWSIKTSSEGRHSVRISGLSTIDFRAGFSRKPTLDFKKTSSRPVQGIPTHILLNTTGLSPPARADRLELLSITGEAIKTLPIRYYPERQPYGLWNITEFIPPNEAFFLRVTGYDRDGFLFQRVSSVSFSSIIPDAPKVLMPATTHGYYLQRGVVKCQVESLIPFTLRFSRDGRRLGVDQLFSESDSASWDIAQVTLKDEGYYECIAISSAGTGRARTFLDVSEPPPAVTIEGNVTVAPGSRAVLTCHVVSTVNFNLTWLRGGHDARLDSQVHVLTNLSLQVSTVTPDHSGWYECIAINEGGVTAERIYLTVQEVPRVSVEPRNQTFTTGEEVRIRCSASGYPPPRLVWTHNDMFIMASSRYRMTPDGTLVIRNMEKKDGGVYGCLASNQAGTDTMTSILTYIESPVVTVALSEILIGIGETTVMACSASGIPQPKIWWYKGDVQLHSSSLLDVDTLGGTLTIKETQKADAGDYSCVAVNAAGTSSGKISLDVGATPKFTREPSDVAADVGSSVSLPCHAHISPQARLQSMSPSKYRPQAMARLLIRPRSNVDGAGVSAEPVRMSVIEGEDAILPCEVHSVPPPTISWAKERQLISPFSPRHTQLPSGSMKILETRVSDSGLYVCVASNIAGNLTQSIELSVLVPPSIQAGPRVIKVQVGHPVELPCVVRGVPEPTLTWTKDGKNYPVSHDGSLALRNVGLDEEGTYTCTATNTAGRDEARVQLLVQVPPVVEVLEPPFNSPLQERVANQRIAFPCPAKGLPKPVIRWLRNGQELTGNEPGVSILEDGTLLILASVSPLDNGEYVCAAVNDAGSTERKYQLKVNVPPDFRDSETPGNVSVVLSQPTSLVCDVTGSPTPVITWYKDGTPVVSSNSIQILDMGKTLRLLKAATADAGSYSCKAINIAGSTEKDFFLDVLVPPTIVGSGSSRDVSAILKQEISLECKVQGVPFPTIQWYKDRKLVFLGDPNLEVTNRGQVLRIKSARLGDQARYQCSVMNTAGKQSKDFNLSVYVPPSIKGGNLTTEVTALLDTVVTLECEARGVPLPTITWYRNGEAILSNRQAQYVDRGHYLKIPRAQASDAGLYTCKVTSVAGSAEKAYELDVYLPPTIAGGDDGPTERKVTLSKALILECEAGGHPPPSLTWLKDGVPVHDGESVRVLEQGKKIEILSATVSDSGRYVCVATSIAGEKEVKYDVRVLVPPFIDGADDLTDSTVILNSPLELECEATGTPVPVITWYKDGKPVRQGEGLRVAASGRRLIVSRAQVSDTARFQCVATNEAGDHERDFNVVVHVPPSIRTTGPSERSVVLHKPISLECISSGIPPPIVTWLKDGRPVDTTQEHLKLESAGRTLKVTDARLEDSGRYTCLATNAAGEAQQHIRLSVHEPPSIPYSGEIINQTILSGFPTELECKATGNPLPAITWYKDGRPLTSAAGVTMLKRGQVLEIERAQLSDAGMYRCVAVNLAGVAEIFHSLQVFVPPVISSRGGTVTVVVNEAARLECEATGVPLPSLTWLKDGSPVASVSHGIQVLSGGRVLSLSSAQVSDTGRYTCVAVNAGGEQNREYDLRVYVPPNIKGEEVNATVMLGRPVELHCQSDAIPPPTLTWRKDGRPLFRKPGLTVSADGSLLKVNSAQVQDSGRYTCEATNVAGKTEKNYNLNVWVSPSIRGSEEVSPLTVVEGSLITLVCESSGIPPPSLTWKKDGSELKSDQRLRVLSGGRQLQISSAERTDAASYTCTASSAAGTTSKEYSLQVYVRPSIRRSEGDNDDVTVTKGGDVTLQCAAEGVPRPAITWLKDGRPITGQHGAKVLNEGRLLQIKDAKVSDTGRYTCIAVNVAGQADSKYDISVH
ncbi:hemicentin-1, partial [Lates japonicus]